MIGLTSIFFLVGGLLLAQSGEPDGTVTGTVTDSLSGSSIPHAEVALNCEIPRSFQKTVSVLTSANGLFRFTNALNSRKLGGYCNASASRIGYLPLSNVMVGTEPLVLKLIPQSVITGTVFDQNGQPSIWAQVQLYRPVLDSGVYGISSVEQGVTDDRGRFRLARLASGAYRVCVTPGSSRYLLSQGITYDRTCSPASSEAPPRDWLRLKTGETLNLRFDAKPLHGVRVSGHLSNFQPYPLTQLLREAPDGRQEAVGTYKWDLEASTFEFPAVLPGDYRIDIQSNKSGVLLRADKRVTVASSDVRGIELTLRPIPEVIGRVTSGDGSALPAEGISVFFRLLPRGFAGSLASVAPDGAFKQALSGSESYWIELSGAAPWHIQSVKQAGHDITTRALQPLPDGSWGTIEIVASRSRGSIDGLARVEKDEDFVVRILQERGGAYAVVDFLGFIGPRHKFNVQSLPPGEYRMLLSRGSVELPYLEPAYIASHSQFFVTVHVVDGQASKVELDPVPDDSHLSP